ncbi:MAG: hypothetical protein COV74_06585 [Candidatus Omnitrophica bacterium CG11_big_fil_rev_8_21_14_0_20_45_26]|uniref:NAD-dependent epimerase/dehydratase domain-containing protein n=1 Tax=Candidatus Abzuiibacterium crystallinum TaxID=1974748 RepID=A0A2H0LQN9_9BACT|nr:MAG: hypothetical protein COV74_06585 [Candidatus Omnitrophica bacterium CG11_big_fil_rev_8_21_14_0_20_45_26]PIW64741.1 MAG: hypothetical protein COW12_04980 [Candidatus Omnitrophica bacterium CG12_big_fil_rev_8_21_14_0_65_45_16]
MNQKESLSRYWKDKKVLITGGVGMIGSYLTELVVQAGAKVSAADNLERGELQFIKPIVKEVQFHKVDLRDAENCKRVVKKQDVVLNLAAKVTGIEYNRTHQKEMFEANMLLQQNMIHAAAHAGVGRFLQVSTACIYPHDALVPTPESEGLRGAPEPTNGGYGWAKRMGERLAEYYTKETDMACVIVRPFNAYGPRDNFDQEKSHVIPALIKKIKDGLDPVPVWGSGDQKRVFVHCRDIARAMMLVTEKAPPADAVNIGHDQMITIKTLFETLCRVLSKHPKPFFDTSMPEGYPERAASVEKLRRITGFVPETSLEDGVREIIEWYERRGKQKRK